MVDSIPFSRAKKNIHRDFADGVMMAELIHHYSPKLVNLHNYPPANSLTKKIENWNTLSNKVLKRLGIQLSKPHIEHIANATPGVIEELLLTILNRFEKPEEEGSLAQNAKKASARAAKNKEEQDKRSEHEEEPEKKQEGPKDVEA
jgi:ribosomal protein L12E/L44/L45/RPP1/RPP2